MKERERPLNPKVDEKLEILKEAHQKIQAENDPVKKEIMLDDLQTDLGEITRFAEETNDDAPKTADPTHEARKSLLNPGAKALLDRIEQSSGNKELWYPGWTQADFQELLQKLREEGIV